MKRIYVYLILSFALLSACSNQADQVEVNPIIFQSEGEQWEATIKNEVIEHNGKNYFNISYQYKGNAEDLNDVERITFAQGTGLGTQVVNLYDPSYKDKLIKSGAYQEEDEDKYGIIIEDIQNNQSKKFTINYALETVELDYTTIDAIRKEGVTIKINWETEEGKYEDQIK